MDFSAESICLLLRMGTLFKYSLSYMNSSALNIHTRGQVCPRPWLVLATVQDAVHAVMLVSEARVWPHQSQSLNVCLSFKVVFVSSLGSV